MFRLDKAIRAWRNELAAEDALSWNDIDELEDHLGALYDAAIDDGLKPTVAFSRACDELGKPEALSAEFSKVDTTAWHRLMFAGWTAFVVSFFLPVHQNGITLLDYNFDMGVLPGYEAFLLALSGEGGFAGTLSALTNFLMLITMWRPARRGSGTTGFLAALMIVSTLLNLWWLTDGASDLLVGFFAWCASFAAVGGGLLLRTRDLSERARPVALADA